MERKADDRGVERPPDLPDVLERTVPAEKSPQAWQELGTEDPAFFIKPSDED